jgi:hypothetical protein
MTKSEIVAELSAKHQAFCDFVGVMDEADFSFAMEGKWTAGQQLDHLCLSVKPLANGLKFPKFLLRMKFGSTKRGSTSYEALVGKYQSALEAGGRASASFIPPPIAFAQKQALIAQLQGHVTKLCDTLQRYSEANLDEMVAPHPLLGTLTLREMLYFTINHVQHHQENIQNQLKSRVFA